MLSSPPKSRFSSACLGLVAPLFFTSAGQAEPPPAPVPGSAPPAVAPPPRTPSVPRPYAYGILVGTNVGGAGQTELRYAEDDARKMAQVLKEVGRYGPTDMKVLVRPSSANVLAVVDDVATKLRSHQAKGEQAVLVFYYSGHAKANAFSLGNEEFPIATLRDKLRQLPTTLTLVVLDACQSGQFARVKGVEPAADFSFNSVSRLTTKGIAVMASSSAQELSQESDQLRSSYFTHHLIVALRGAADTDGDGRVSLDEAYRYAYRRTLVSTSQTQVGGQHVTLETDLAGQGDVPVTYPADARAQLELPGPLEARVLVQHKSSGTIVAEVQKIPGPPLKLALPAGAYEGIVREGVGKSSRVAKCSLTLTDGRVTALDVGGCESVKLVGMAKGGEPSWDDEHTDREDATEEHVVVDKPQAARRTDDETNRPPLQVELGFGFMWRTQDAYTRRLNEFGYEDHANPFFEFRPRFRLHAGASVGVTSHLSVGAVFHTLEGDRYMRDVSDSDDTFSWDAYGLSAFVRASAVPFGRLRGKGRFVELYAQGALGLSLGHHDAQHGGFDFSGHTETTDTHWGYVLGGQGGVALSPGGPVVFFLQGGYEYAPTIANLLDDTHNSGGPSVQIGTRLRF